MTDVTVTVEAGICQFKTVINASLDDDMNVVYNIKSGCASVRNMAKDLKPMPLMDVVMGPITENQVYKCCACLEHACCVVPSAMIKAGEVAGDLALKKNVSFTFE